MCLSARDRETSNTALDGPAHAVRPLDPSAKGPGRTERFRPSRLFNIHISSTLSLWSSTSANGPGRARGFRILLVGRARPDFGWAGRATKHMGRAGPPNLGVRPTLMQHDDGVFQPRAKHHFQGATRHEHNKVRRSVM